MEHRPDDRDAQGCTRPLEDLVDGTGRTAPLDRHLRHRPGLIRRQHETGPESGDGQWERYPPSDVRPGLDAHGRGGREESDAEEQRPPGERSDRVLGALGTRPP